MTHTPFDSRMAFVRVRSELAAGLCLAARR